MSTNSILSTNIVLGSLVLLSYYVLLPRTLPSGKVEPLWFGIDGKVRQMYYLSMVLTVVGYLGALWWIHTHASSKTRHTYVNAYIVTLLGALSWSVALWVWGRSTQSRALAVGGVFGALLLTTLGAWWLVGTAYANRAPWWVISLLGVYVFHVTVLDNGGWFYAFYVHQ